MAFLNKLIIILCAITLMALAVNLALINLVSSPSDLNTAFDQGGVYDAIAPGVANTLISGISTDVISADTLSTAARKAVTGTAIRSSLQPVIFSLSDWFKKPADVPPPALTIDMGPIKTALTSELANDIPADQVDAAQFEITKSIPDQLDLTTLNKTTDNSSDQSVKNDPYAGVKGVKSTYASATSYPVPLAIAAGFWAVLLIVLNWRRGRHRLTSLGWASILAGGLCFVVMYAVPFLVQSFVPTNSDKTGINPSTIVGSLANVVSRGLMPFAITYLVVGGLFYVIGFVFLRTDKNHKK